MITFGLQAAQPIAADGAALGRVLQRAGVSKACTVRVTGLAGPTAVLWLARHGYERASFVHPNFAAKMAPADALLIPQLCPAKALAEILGGGDCVREGGALVVQSDWTPSTLPSESTPALLASLGYQVRDHVSDRGREVYIARRTGLGRLDKAA